MGETVTNTLWSSFTTVQSTLQAQFKTFGVMAGFLDGAGHGVAGEVFTVLTEGGRQAQETYQRLAGMWFYHLDWSADWDNLTKQGLTYMKTIGVKVAHALNYFVMNPVRYLLSHLAVPIATRLLAGAGGLGCSAPARGARAW